MSDPSESWLNWKVPAYVVVGLGVIYGLYVLANTIFMFESLDTRKASAQFLSACIGVNEGIGKPKECLNFYNEVAPKIMSSDQKMAFLSSVNVNNFKDLHGGLQTFLNKAKGNAAYADWSKLKPLDEIYGNQKPQ